MKSNTKWRFVLIGLLAVLLLFLIVVLNIRETKMCMGVEIAPADYLNDKQEIAVDVRDYILFQEEKVAMDRDDNIIYITNQIGVDTKAQDLYGRLGIELNEYELKFIYCEQFENLQQAVKENHKFTLVAENGQGYIKFDVVFTTLPVVKMSTGDFLYMHEDREVHEADITLWAPYDASVGTHSVKNSKIKYHYRGWSSYYSSKKSYRISALDTDGAKRNISFLDLGEDDDWILNAMTMDDTRIKERLCMNLWNEYVQTADYNYKMSQGEYVEVVADGVYRGVYMLQRRPDQKYLGLSDNDILFKRNNIMDYTTAEEGYEIKYSPLSEEDTYKILNDIFFGENLGIINAENLADINLFMEMGAMYDNVQKNIYFILKHTGDGYELNFLLWDTDMTFGIVWTSNGIIYDEARALKGTPKRPETKKYIELNPEYEKILAEKWKILREKVLTDENIQYNMDECYNQLADSGAHTRERERWKHYTYGGADTKEAMESYIAKRLEKMDEKYLN